LKYRFEEIIYSNSTISKEEPKAVTPNAAVAIIAHIFYIDIWREIYAYIKEWEQPYDLYISVQAQYFEPAK